MTWSADHDLPALRELPFVVTLPAAAAAAAPASASAIYPDHWWGQEFWNDLRSAGRYHAAINAIRLPQPPDAAATRAELDELLRLQVSPELAARIPEILEEADAPPSYYKRMLFLDGSRNVQTGALLSRTVGWARPFIMAFKHRWKRPRPAQLEPRLRPAVECPGHAAFPSGHSTQSHLVALVMGEVTGSSAIRDALWTAADRIAENREYAGLHYASDSACGVELARALLPLFLAEHGALVARARAEEWS